MSLIVRMPLSCILRCNDDGTTKKRGYDYISMIHRSHTPHFESTAFFHDLHRTTFTLTLPYSHPLSSSPAHAAYPFTMIARQAARSTLRTLPGVRAFSSSVPARKVYENVDAATFQSRVLAPTGADAETPVLVDFFATWCQPCKLLSPALKKVASQPDVVGGKHIDLVTIDVDAHQDIAQQFKVSAMPTVIAMKGGKVRNPPLPPLSLCVLWKKVNESNADQEGAGLQVLDGFVGMLPEKKVVEFVQNLK